MAVVKPCPAATRLGPRRAVPRQAVRRSRALATRCQATNDSKASSNAAFLGKLLATSVVGAAAIKYGSLAIDLPFQPSPAIALSFIIGPCIACAAYLVSLSAKP